MTFHIMQKTMYKHFSANISSERYGLGIEITAYFHFSTSLKLKYNASSTVREEALFSQHGRQKVQYHLRVKNPIGRSPY